MTTVLLGVFCSESFQDLKDIFGRNSVYSHRWGTIFTNDHFDCSILPQVNWALSQCEEIVFDITHIRFSRWTDKSFAEVVTLNELLLVITTPEYLEKVTFFKHGKQVDKNVVVNKVLFNKYFDRALT